MNINIFKYFTAITMLCLVSNVFATSSLFGKSEYNTSTNELDHKIKIINEELTNLTKKLNEIEKKNPNDKRILEYKKKISNLLNERYKLKLKNPEYKKTLEYVNSDEHMKIMNDVANYEKNYEKMIYNIITVLTGLIILICCCILLLRKSKNKRV